MQRHTVHSQYTVHNEFGPDYARPYSYTVYYFEGPTDYAALLKVVDNMEQNELPFQRQSLAERRAEASDAYRLLYDDYVEALNNLKTFPWYVRMFRRYPDAPQPQDFTNEERRLNELEHTVIRMRAALDKASLLPELFTATFNASEIDACIEYYNQQQHRSNT